MNYLDELEMLRLEVTSKFPEMTIQESEELSLEERRTRSSKHWAVFMALEKCYDCLMTDPLDKLNDILNDMNINATFSKQQINKDHYSDAAEAIEYMINFIKERRK